MEGLHALIVDDNFANREVARLVLSRVGLRTTQCPSGSEALALARRHSFDVVLMDIQMPLMSGPEAACRLRRFETPDRRPPIFALTAYHSPSQTRVYAAQGLDGTMTKPLSVEHLRLLLHDYTPPETLGANVSAKDLLALGHGIEIGDDSALRHASQIAGELGCEALSRRCRDAVHGAGWRQAALDNCRRELIYVVAALRRLNAGQGAAIPSRGRDALTA